jgi:hypothetical protein
VFIAAILPRIADLAQRDASGQNGDQLGRGAGLHETTRNQDIACSFTTRCREQLAKVNTVLDIFVFRRQPKFFGPKVPIGPVAQKEPI